MEYIYKNREGVSRVTAHIDACPDPGVGENNRISFTRVLYLPGEQKMTMKKQGVQKTQGHKGRDRGDTASPGSSKAADPVTKGQIDSLKDKNAAKKKKGKR